MSDTGPAAVVGGGLPKPAIATEGGESPGRRRGVVACRGVVPSPRQRRGSGPGPYGGSGGSNPARP